jgi:hypothetical protein
MLHNSGAKGSKLAVYIPEAEFFSAVLINDFITFSNFFVLILIVEMISKCMGFGNTEFV